VFELHARTRAAIASYPSVPVIYRRPVLRAAVGLMLGVAAAGLVLLVLSPPTTPSDRLTRDEWWLGPVFLGILGGLYLYVASRMDIDATHVRICNPFRRVDVPLAHIISVHPGSNLRIETDYAVFTAWGVEAANAQVMLGRYGTQDRLARLIREASTHATDDSLSPARYRWAWPDPFFVTCAIALALFSLAVALGPQYWALAR
jgi:hypothetical protein